MGTATRSLPARVVLVVDDEDLVCHLAARILADAGFHVEQAHSGAEAVARLSALDGGVQVVVSDITMPGMTGLELATTVAARWPALPVLLMSAQGRAAHRLHWSFPPETVHYRHVVEAVLGFMPAEGGRA